MQLSTADVLAILAIVKDSSFESLHLQVGEQTLALDRGAEQAPEPQADAASAGGPGTLLDSPRLGIFRPAVQAGARVEAGQPIAMLDVLGTQHAVTTDSAGIVQEFLAADGDLIEYAQPIAHLSMEAA